MAQNQQNDKPAFSEAKMLYQTINMTQFSGYFPFEVENLPLPNAKIIQHLTYHTTLNSTAQHT
jgi:hypothetical protein